VSDTRTFQPGGSETGFIATIAPCLWNMRHSFVTVSDTGTWM
jgi:hypothetical protein